MTLLLTRSDLAAVLDVNSAITALRHGFTLDNPPEITGQRVCTDLPGPGTATALLPGLLPDIPAYTVKVNAKFPDARPASRGVVCLHSLADGTLLALLDSATITAWRTGLSAALASQHLTSLGVDEPGKQELADDILRTATLVVDDPTLVRRTGVLQRTALHDIPTTTLSAVLGNSAPGRTSRQQITTYAPVGLP